MFFITQLITALSLLLLTCHATAPSLPVAFCSSLNTGAANQEVTSIYQSQGLCKTQCEADWAFGVLLDQKCWCTNFAPGVSTDSSDCADSCPGYPSDTCGNTADNLFEYIALNLSPSGTQGASSAAASTSNPPVTVTVLPAPVTISPPPVTIIETPSPSLSSAASSSPLPTVVIESASTASSDEAQSTSAAASTTAKTSATSPSSSSSTWTPTPVASIETVTNGQIKTVTITPTSSPGSVASQTLAPVQKSSGGGSSLSGGQAAGLTIGLIALIAIVSGIVYFCWRKRKQHKQMSEYGGLSRQGSVLVSSGPHPPSRTMSENSRYVLATDGRAVYPAWENDDNQAGSRSSRLVPVDPRLDPYAGIYQQPRASRSHDSINTINDGRDYSRRVATAPVLRAMNPDPETPRR